MRCLRRPFVFPFLALFLAAASVVRAQEGPPREAPAQEGPPREAPAQRSEAFFFQADRYWHVSLLDERVVDQGTTAALAARFLGLDPDLPLRAALPGDFDQDGEGDLFLLQDDRYAIVQLRSSQQIAPGTIDALGLNPNEPVSGASVLRASTIVAAQGRRVTLTRFVSGIPSLVTTLEREDPVDAVVAWREFVFLFSGTNVHRIDLRTRQEVVFPLEEVGLVGPVDAASLGPSPSSLQIDSIWAVSGETVRVASLHGKVVAQFTLTEVAEKLALEGFDPTRPLNGLAAYSLREMRWPWAFYALEMQWGYRDPWSGDAPPSDTAPTTWDGSLAISGPEMTIPSLSGDVPLALRGGGNVSGAVFSWTHTNMMEPSSLYPDSNDSYEKPSPFGRYHYFAGGFSWVSTTTARWDGVDTGFYYSLPRAGETKVTIEFSTKGWGEEWFVLPDLVGFYRVYEMDGLAHKLELGPTDELVTDVADAFVEFGYMPGELHGHGGDGGGHEGECPPEGYTLSWDGYVELLDGPGYLQLSSTIDFEEGGTDEVQSPYAGVRRVAWRSVTVDPGMCMLEKDGVAFEVAMPNPKFFGPGPQVRAVVRNTVTDRDIVITSPPLDPPQEYHTERDAGTGYGHSVHAMIHWCWFNAD